MQRCCTSTAVSAAQQKSEPPGRAVRAAVAHHQQIDSHMESTASLQSREKVQAAHTAASSEQ
jgi:hypothetical protein